MSVPRGRQCLTFTRRPRESSTFFSYPLRTSLTPSRSVNWQIMAHACAFSAVTICTAYDSLGPQGLSHSLQEPNVRSMFTNAELLPTLTKVIESCPFVRLVVYDGEPSDAVLAELRAKRDDLKVIHIDQVERLGAEKPKESIRANPDDVFCVMYTSGSTGTPKGVMLTHKNIVAAVGAIWHLLYEYLTPVDTYLAFLPLAHILEFVIETSWLFAGLSIGYGKIKTLTDASVKDSQGDILEFKPVSWALSGLLPRLGRSDGSTASRLSRSSSASPPSGNPSARESSPKSTRPAASRRESSTRRSSSRAPASPGWAPLPMPSSSTPSRLKPEAV